MRKRRWLMLIPLWLLGMWLLSCGFTALSMGYLQRALSVLKPGATEETRQQASRKILTARTLSTVAIWLNPLNASAYRNRGIARAHIYDKLHDYQSKALPDMTIAIKLNPHDPIAYLYHAVAYGQSHEKVDLNVVADYNAALALNPQDSWMSYCLSYEDRPFVHMDRGLAYASLGRNDLAIADFTFVVTRQPQDWWAYDKRSKAYDRLGQYELAAADYTTVLALEDPSHFWDRYEKRADDYVKLGKYDLAVADYTSEIAFSSDGQLFFKRGTAYQQLGQSALANADFARAYELGYRSR